MALIFFLCGTFPILVAIALLNHCWRIYFLPTHDAKVVSVDSERWDVNLYYNTMIELSIDGKIIKDSLGVSYTYPIYPLGTIVKVRYDAISNKLISNLSLKHRCICCIAFFIFGLIFIYYGFFLGGVSGK